MYKNYITHDEYLKIKERSVKKSYALRFKKLRTLGLIFSYFGHFTSIFFAYFFFITLFTGTVFAVNPIGLGIGIIVFLTLFEWIKRYTFDLFSLEYVKNKHSLIKSNMFSFVFTTFIFISLSFFFSLKGAKDIINNEKTIEISSETISKSQIDSINSIYKIEIENSNNEISSLSERIDRLSIDRSEKVKKNWATTKEDKQIEELTLQKSNIISNIENIKNERDDKIKNFEIKNSEKLEKEQNLNDLSILYFLLISFFIELSIMAGVIYNRIYDNKVVEEYENEIMKDPKHRKWMQMNQILDLIFHKDFQINDYLPSSAEILDISKINELNITEKDLENCFKILSHLKIYERSGKNRILKIDKENSKKLLKEHFKVDQK
jgi:hypothetical protein